MNQDPLHKTAEAADYLNSAEATLRFWRSRGDGPKWAKIGRHVMYRQSDLDAWLEARFELAAAGE